MEIVTGRITAMWEARYFIKKPLATSLDHLKRFKSAAISSPTAPSIFNEIRLSSPDSHFVENGNVKAKSFDPLSVELARDHAKSP